jgi:SAM-dependent methyltransferase
MFHRMLEWGLLEEADYTAIDLDDENVREARRSTGEWADARGYSLEGGGEKLILSGPGQRVSAQFLAAELYEFIRQNKEKTAWDLLVAHAFLDLLDLEKALPRLFSVLKPGGLFYFTINYDGLTILEPLIDPDLDELILKLYNRTMDARIVDGRPSGDSRTGRHLFAHLEAAGAEVLAAGSSDWVVYPQKGCYTGDEAYFLHFIIHTIESALRGHPELDSVRFNDWVKTRHAQVENGELVYIAHQMDFMGCIM